MISGVLICPADAGPEGGRPAVNMREIVQAAREQGWEVSRTSRGHWRFVPPDPAGEIVIASGTPGHPAGDRAHAAPGLRLALARQVRGGIAMAVWDIDLEGLSPDPLDDAWAGAMVDLLAQYGAAVSYRDRRCGFSLSVHADTILGAAGRAAGLVALVAPDVRIIDLRVAEAPAEAEDPAGPLSAAS